MSPLVAFLLLNRLESSSDLFAIGKLVEVEQEDVATKVERFEQCSFADPEGDVARGLGARLPSLLVVGPWGEMCAPSMPCQWAPSFCLATSLFTMVWILKLNRAKWID
jgi:hypothetical protein